jgi:hypothetical protein
MIPREDLTFGLQDRLDAERLRPVPTISELAAAQLERESFRMLGLFGEIPGSSCEPIRVQRWATSDH